MDIAPVCLVLHVEHSIERCWRFSLLFFKLTGVYDFRTEKDLLAVLRDAKDDRPSVFA